MNEVVLGACSEFENDLFLLNRLDQNRCMCVHVPVHVHVRMCVRACVRACVS